MINPGLIFPSGATVALRFLGAGSRGVPFHTTSPAAPALVSSKSKYAFLVPLKGLFVMNTFTSDDVSSCRQFLTASVTSSDSSVSSISSISSSTLKTRWRTDPVSSTTSRKAESNLPLSFAAHFTSTRRYCVLVSLILLIVTSNSSGSIFLLNLKKYYWKSKIQFFDNNMWSIRKKLNNAKLFILVRYTSFVWHSFW